MCGLCTTVLAPIGSLWTNLELIHVIQTSGFSPIGHLEPLYRHADHTIEHLYTSHNNAITRRYVRAHLCTILKLRRIGTACPAKETKATGNTQMVFITLSHGPFTDQARMQWPTTNLAQRLYVKTPLSFSRLCFLHPFSGGVISVHA